MTSFAFIFGLLPLLLATRLGSAVAAHPRRRSSSSGMAGATLLGLFVTPSLFVLVERLSHRVRRPRGARRQRRRRRR